jgi:hypothetical protein
MICRVEKRDSDNVSSIERRKPNQVRAKQEVRSSPWVKKGEMVM